jgi:hypothetical protein
MISCDKPVGHVTVLEFNSWHAIPRLSVYQPQPSISAEVKNVVTTTIST